MRNLDKGFGGVGVGSGGISILAIFVVLCLTTLATLSIVSARADFVLTQKTSQASAQYYIADSLAEEKLVSISEVLTKENWETKLIDLGCEVTKVGDKLFASYSTPINDTKQLISTLELITQNGIPNGQFKKIAWSVSVNSTYETQNTMNVLI